MTILEIHARIMACTDCPLRAGCKQPVPGSGSEYADVMFVGEGPGAEEDGQGNPFMGPSGQMLRDFVASLELDNDPFYTNVVKCRPPNNRDPYQSEINSCLHYLDEQIEAINPRVIVAVGRHAMRQFLPDDSIMKARGTPRIVHGRVVLPIVHTAAALYSPELKPLIAGDLRLIPRLLDTPLESSHNARLTIL
jgi:DNA polymerase